VRIDPIRVAHRDEIEPLGRSGRAAGAAVAGGAPAPRRPAASARARPVAGFRPWRGRQWRAVPPNPQQPHKVQERFRHADIATTRIYDHRKTRPEDSSTFKVNY